MLPMAATVMQTASIWGQGGTIAHVLQVIREMEPFALVR